jgi:hypothetical protein
MSVMKEVASSPNPGTQAHNGHTEQCARIPYVVSQQDEDGDEPASGDGADSRMLTGDRCRLAEQSDLAEKEYAVPANQVKPFAAGEALRESGCMPKRHCAE